MFKLPQLPYETSLFAPWQSSESFEYHYGKHHKGYIEKLNSLIEGTDNQKKSLEEIILTSKGELFDNAAQAWNHTFFWNSFTPMPLELNKSTELYKAITSKYGSVSEFKVQFAETATDQFGSGWAWLCKDNQGNLEITSTSNAATPLTDDKLPLLTCDVWEHAYYIDHRNERLKYVQGFLSQIDWEFAELNFKSSRLADMSKLMR